MLGYLPANTDSVMAAYLTEYLKLNIKAECLKAFHLFCPILTLPNEQTTFWKNWRSLFPGHQLFLAVVMINPFEIHPFPNHKFSVVDLFL